MELSYNEYMRTYMKEYSLQRKLRVHELLGGRCECGRMDGLHVHHIDPSTKSFTLASGWHHSWDTIEEEARKCILLCEDCHRDRHRAKHPHGDVKRYWRGCRCDECRKANTQHNREYRASRSK